MISYKDIRDVHLEIATLCNASCPWCPRTFWGYPYNGGYPELYMPLHDAQKIFKPDFLKQLTTLHINGNYGDIVMNPDGLDIVRYFKSHNPDLSVTINTNGSGRNKTFWTGLAQTGAQVSFALDGLSDTHHLYRQNTSWQRVIKNAKYFIESGGHAIWQMIQFDHNRHQIRACREMSQSLGFQEFRLILDGRDTAPVFDRHGKFTHVIGKYSGETEFKILFHAKKNNQVLLEDIVINKSICAAISCDAVKRRSIYIAANGDVSPCCWTGFYPRTYGHGQYHQAANAQLVPLIKKNNALEHPLDECIQWFSGIKDSWKIKTYEQGRLVICDDNCGHQTIKSNK